MPVYRCRVTDAAGTITEFAREAVSEEPLLRELASRRLFVLSLREASAGEVRGSPGGGFSRSMVGELTDLLALMLGSGLSLKDSLEVAETVCTRGKAAQLVTLLLAKIRKGSSFAAALEAAGGSFPPVYRGMVRIGERTGSLDLVFPRLSSYLAEEKKMRERVAAALLYPAVVLGVALASAILIIVVLFPRLREIFAQLGPGMAAKVETLMTSLTSVFAGAVALAVMAASCFLWAVRARRHGGSAALRIDAFALRLPVVSTFLLQRELLNFSFAMEALTAAGVGVEEALTESAGALRNSALKAEIARIREHVVNGGHLSAAFARSALFPARVARWVGIGERVGHVEKVFTQLRAYYQQEVEKWVARLMALIEPAIIVVLGILIFLFVVVFVVPIFSLYGSVL
jgi:type II secretory pathway component PulF